MDKYECELYGYVYDPAEGDRDGGKLRLVSLLRTFRKRGTAPCAEQQKIILLK